VNCPLIRDLNIIKKYKKNNNNNYHYHCCHISSKDSVDLIRKAKNDHLNITAEVTPHHLFMCDDDFLTVDSNNKMNPPIRELCDREALIDGINDGTLDCIATDHAPHLESLKRMSIDIAPFGVVGLETAFPLLYTYLVIKRKNLSLSKLINLLSINPANIFSLKPSLIKENEKANLTAIDLDNIKKVELKNFYSFGKNTPFNNLELRGWPILTMCNGKIAYEKM